MNTNFQTIHQMGNAVSEMVRQATGRNSVQSMDMDWVTVEQVKKWIYGEDSGDIVSFVTNLRNGITQLRASIMPVQDLHGFDNPWPGGGGSNILPCLLSSIKSNNTTGTWDNDSYSLYGITFQFTANAEGYVTSIKVSGTATDNATVRVYANSTGLPAGNYIVNGCPEDGGSGLYYIRLYDVNGTSGGTAMYDYGSGVTIEDTYTIKRVNVTVENGNTVSNLYFYPMVRKSSVTDDSFVPYTNICPITGWNMCNVFVTGKNLLNPDEFTEGYYINDSGVMTESQYGTVSGFIPAKVGKIYALSGKATENSAGYRSITGYDSEGNFIQQWKLTGMAPAGSGYGMIVNNTNPLIKMFRITFFKDVDINVQFEITTSMETAYEEFTGNTYSFIWSNEDPGIVYMGSVDAITGILTVNASLVTYDGSEDENWQIQGGTYKYGTIHVSDLDYAKRKNSISDTFAYASIGNSNSNIGFGFVSTNDLCIRKALDTSLTASDFKQYLSLNPVKILYPINPPVTYQLDPNTVESIVGTNYVMADAGNVSVEYRHEEEMP